MKVARFFSVMIIFVVFLSGCNKDPIVTGEFSKMVVTEKENVVLKTEKKDDIEKIVEQINTSRRERTSEMSFAHPPEGKITLKNDKKTVDVEYFISSGDVMTKGYIIHTNLDFEASQKDSSISSTVSKPAQSVTFDVNHQGDSVPLSKKEIKTLKEMTDWKVSPEFAPGNRVMTGIKNQVAFLNAGDPQWQNRAGDKVMWFFWGDTEKIKEKKFSIVAIHKESGSVERVLTNPTANIYWTTANPSNPHFGADAHLPTNMIFPKSGLWCLNAFLGEDLVGQIVVEIK